MVAALLGVIFVAAKRPALIAVADRIGRQRGLRGHRLVQEIAGLALRVVAVAAGIAVVPPTVGIVGDAVEDLVADMGVLQPDADKRHQVLGLEPNRQPPPVGRRVADIADPQTGDAYPVLLGIERAERFAERLADAVAAVRAHRHIDADALVARIEADGVIGGGEYHALDAGAAGGLEQIVSADDIGLQDRVPRAFDRVAAEMHDAVDAGDDFLDRGEVGEIGGHEIFIAREIGGLAQITPADARVEALQGLAQARADAARGAGDEKFFHGSLL